MANQPPIQQFATDRDILADVWNPSTHVLGTSGSGGGATLPSTGANNQATVPTGTSTALGSNTLTQGVIVQALSTNTVSIYVGFSGTTVANGFELQPGQATSFAVNNTNLIYSISGSASQKLCFVGS